MGPGQPFPFVNLGAARAPIDTVRLQLKESVGRCDCAVFGRRLTLRGWLAAASTTKTFQGVIEVVC